MRTALLLTFAFACTGFVYGQKTEIRVNAYSGLFYFRGSGSAPTVPIYIGDDIGYQNSKPYGRKSDFSYAFELQAQRVTKQKHLYGVGLSFERLTSRQTIDSVSYTFISDRPATGKVTLANDFITASPYVGQRFLANKITLDVQAGVDLAFSTRVYEQAKITSEKDATYSLNYSNHPVDIRPRLQVNAYHNKVGLLAGYSIGLTDFYHHHNFNYQDRKAYTNFFRVGVSYRLK